MGGGASLAHLDFDDTGGGGVLQGLLLVVGHIRRRLELRQRDSHCPPSVRRHTGLGGGAGAGELEPHARAGVAVPAVPAFVARSEVAGAVTPAPPAASGSQGQLGPPPAPGWPGPPCPRPACAGVAGAAGSPTRAGMAGKAARQAEGRVEGRGDGAGAEAAHRPAKVREMSGR